MKLAAPRGVILDVDGTLVDSNDAHTRAWVSALARGAYDVPYERVRPLIGMGSDKLLPKLVGVQKESEEGKELTEAWTEIFQSDYLPHLKPFPSVKELLGRMRESGLKLVVASSAEKKMLDALLKIAGADDFVEAKTSAGDAGSSKPDPDIVKVALDELGYRAEEAVMLGDTPYDIEAARKIGVDTIALRCGGWDDQGLTGAIAIYDDPADLLARYDHSPLANTNRRAL